MKTRCLLMVLALLLIAELPHPSAAMTLTRQDNRLFSDGLPIRLVGYGCYGMVSESSFEMEAFLDRLSQHGLNFVRVWVLFHWTNDLTPFSGSRSSKYDLLTPNAEFYARLREFVRLAEERRIVVQVCLFDGVALTGGSDTNRWPNFPYNTANNLQNYLTNPGQFNDIPSEWWSQVTQPLIDRVVEELGDYGNVIYEAMNEPDTHGVDTSSPQFNQAIVDRLYERLALPQYTGSKLISVNPEAAVLREWAKTSDKVDLIAYHVKDPEDPLSITWNEKPVLISNDGDISQQTEAFGGLPPQEREARIQTLLTNTFTLPHAEGTRHFECLDKGLYGDTWRSQDYDPRYEHRNEGLLEILNRSALQRKGAATSFRAH